MKKQPVDVCYGSLADLRSRMLDVRFTPQSGHAQRPHRCLLSAKSGHCVGSGFKKTAFARLRMVVYLSPFIHACASHVP
jgi:hypothetical protein